MISQGLVTHGSELIDSLLSIEWEGVIVDEAHRARRKKLPKSDEFGPAIGKPETEANRLYAFLFRLAPQTRSLLMATATPIQMHPIEAWDLLRVLSEGNDHVLGSTSSYWRKPEEGQFLPHVGRVVVVPESPQEGEERLGVGPVTGHHR